MKHCSRCGKEKPFSDFRERKTRSSDGFQGVCKECENARSRELRAENADVFRAREKAWRDNNKEKLNARKRKWKTDHIDQVRESQRAYRNSHPKQAYLALKNWLLKYPEKIRERNHARRARKLKNGGIITTEEWTELCNNYGNKCLCCGRSDVKLTLDHVIPLSCGGSNTIDNAQCLCKSCNSRKGTKTIDYRR